ncbi:MAG: GerAB/ArcD/ProY family transporter [Oscillospiraceae bacterium]|nr:GerAB/ArcD/ProY family transporter [Oscillospiraceae bacterium]
MKNGLTVLMINIICVKLFLTFPRALVINSGTGAWLQMLICTAAAYLIFFAGMRIYRVCGSRDMIEVSREIGGNALAGAVGVVLFCALGINTGILMRAFPESIKMFLLPDAEIEQIVIIFAAAAVFGAYMGLNALVNLISIIIIPASAVIIIFLVSLFGECDLSNISPVLGKGIASILSGWSALSVFSDIILFTLIISEFESAEEAEKSGRRAIIYSGAVAVLITVVYTMMYPYPMSSEIIMPVYKMVRSVDVVGVFRRAESVLAFVWCIFTFISAGVYVYYMSLSLKKGFSLRDRKMLIIPSAVTAASAAVIDINIPDRFAGGEIPGACVFWLSFILFVLTAALYILKKRAVRK